jgi:hypothetical protein
MLIFTFSDLLNSEYWVLFLKDSWIKLWWELWAVDLGNYYNKQQTYSNEEAVASISEVVTIDETDYQLTRAWNIIYCTDEVYQALYDWGILDNEPYASMIFFTSK